MSNVDPLQIPVPEFLKPIFSYISSLPATSVQRISHPHRTRSHSQCPARPRHSPDIIKSIRLGRSEDPSAPHHSPQAYSLSPARCARRRGRSHDRVVDQMGNRRRSCVRRTSLVFGRYWRYHRTESHRDGIGHVQCAGKTLQRAAHVLATSAWLPAAWDSFEQHWEYQAGGAVNAANPASQRPRCSSSSRDVPIAQRMEIGYPTRRGALQRFLRMNRQEYGGDSGDR